MENVRELKRHIKSVESTGKIVRAMKTVAVTKLRRSQRKLAGAQEYMQSCRRLMGHVGAAAGDAAALTRDSESGVPCYVLITGNRGLCGEYNHELLDFFRQLTAERGGEYAVVVCGKWGAENTIVKAMPVCAVFEELGDIPSHEQCAEISRYLVDGFKGGRFCSVELVHQEFINVLKQKPSAELFLPAAQSGGEESAESGCIFEPDAQSVMEALTERYLYASLYAVILSAKVGEHAARMTAMTAASDSADEMTAELTRRLNQARQTSVTEEMLELSGGAAHPEDEQTEGKDICQ